MGTQDEGAPFHPIPAPPALATAKPRWQLCATTVQRLEVRGAPSHFWAWPAASQYPSQSSWVGSHKMGMLPSPTPYPSLLMGAAHGCWLSFALARVGGVGLERGVVLPQHPCLMAGAGVGRLELHPAPPLPPQQASNYWVQWCSNL